ncbi:SMC-Scp complex subunit ScpB [Paenibacillus senegalensis]|uniref:SMC-Scp complex subunit ScpB n=1 Tax=Paenibacillus senegalensis TaxID=1465766 RepID=UPI000288E826|nr:SMC-Scp complex subunit ScpB [Paenibacillus senegalensis]
MQLQQMKSIIEGLLFVAGDEGLDNKQLAEVMELDAKDIQEVVRAMQSEFRETGRGIQIVEMAGVYQLTTVPEHAPYFERLAYSPNRTSLSQAALETLSIIAYKQPITRVEIEEVRGVKSDRALQTLVAKELIEEKGRAEAIGRPILYGTTKQFLDYFGLSSLDQLPDQQQFDEEIDLEEETRLLFEKMDVQQLTIDDVDKK